MYSIGIEDGKYNIKQNSTGYVWLCGMRCAWELSNCLWERLDYRQYAHITQPLNTEGESERVREDKLLFINENVRDVGYFGNGIGLLRNAFTNRSELHRRPTRTVAVWDISQLVNIYWPDQFGPVNNLFKFISIYPFCTHAHKCE